MESKYKLDRDYRKVKIKTKKIRTGVVLTNNYGLWCYLEKKDYDKFIFDDMDEKLFNKLEKHFMILTENNENDITHQINDYFWFIGKGATLHIMVPTLRCNFTCKYCYAFRCQEEEQNKDMTPETVDQTIDFIFNSPADVYSIEFTGGEPLLRIDLVKRAIERAEMLKEKTGKRLFFSIVTNGVLLTEEMIEYFKEHKVGLCLSLDGPKELNDSHRRITSGNKPTYDQISEKLALLNKMKFPSVNSIPVITKGSLGYWKEIVDEYVNQGFNTLRFKYVSRFGFASNAWDQMSYKPEEFVEAWKKVINYMIELNKKGIHIAENLASIILQKLVTGIDPGYAELQVPCGAVIGQIVYDYDGSIYSCDEGRTMEEFKVGHVATSTYKDVLSCPVTKTLQSISNLTASCDNCSWQTYCGICPLEIYNVEKGFITNIPANYRCKIHMELFNFLFEKLIFDEEAREHLIKWPFYIKGMNKNDKMDKRFEQDNYAERFNNKIN